MKLEWEALHELENTTCKHPTWAAKSCRIFYVVVSVNGRCSFMAATETAVIILLTFCQSVEDAKYFCERHWESIHESA